MPYARGLKQHVSDPRDLRLANYYDHTESAAATGIALPDSGHSDIVKPGEWGMLLNDQVGSCFPAGEMHAQLILARLGGHDPVFDDAAVGQTYAELTGWNGKPGDPSDTGVEPREGLRFLQQTGMLDAKGRRHRIGAYVWLERGDAEQLVAAIKEFEIVGTGYELPENAETDFNSGYWRFVPGSPIVGGHWVISSGTKGGYIETVSWAEVVLADRLFYERHCMCAAVYISHAQLNGEGKTPEGLDFERLKADLAALSA